MTNSFGSLTQSDASFRFRDLVSRYFCRSMKSRTSRQLRLNDTKLWKSRNDKIFSDTSMKPGFQTPVLISHSKRPIRTAKPLSFDI